MKMLLIAMVSAALTLGATALVATAGSEQSSRSNAVRVVKIGDTVDMTGIDLRCRYLPSPTGASGSPSFVCQRRSLLMSGAVGVSNTLVDVGESTISVWPATKRVKLFLPGRVQKTFNAGTATVDRSP